MTTSERERPSPRAAPMTRFPTNPPTLTPTVRFSVDEFIRLAELGAFGDDQRIELLDGVMVPMVPIGPWHAGTTDKVNQRFNRAGYEVIVRVQSPIRLSKTSLPQPDVSILRADPDFYVDGHPTPADVYLVIEVVDSTEKRDRELKLPLCAQAGIPEVWLVYRRRAVVVQHLDPQGGVYQRIREFKRGSSISPAAFPNVVIAVDDILGKRR